MNRRTNQKTDATNTISIEDLKTKANLEKTNATAIKKLATKKIAYDKVDIASMESFPASDSPGW